VSDDDRWLEGLAGRTADDSAAAREARALREAILRREPSAIDVTAVDAAREQLLLERARREGLMGRSPARRSHWGLSLAAAVIASIGLTLWFVGEQTDAPFVVRSAGDGTIRIEASDPRALKLQVLEDLRAAGIDATGYERLGVEGIDADLPEAISDDMRMVFRRYGLTAPHNRALRIEIERREQP
jgi:hypothetical protein